VLLRHVARHADLWNNLGAYHAEVGRKRDVLAAHCRAVGRDPADIEVVQQTLGAIATDRAEAGRRTEKVLHELGFLDGSPELALTGTPAEIQSRVELNRARGVTGFILSFGRRTDPETVRLFGHEIVSAYR